MEYRYLISPAKNSPAEKLNLLALKRAFSQLPGGGDCIEYVRRKEDGDLLLQVAPDNPSFEAALRSLKTINDVDIKIQAPLLATYVMGVASHPEIELLTADEIKELTQPSGVVYARKLGKNTALLGFTRHDSSTTPSHVILGWDTVKIRPHVPRPRSCFNCQEYGHVVSCCTRKIPVCCKCGQEGHVRADCPAAIPHCARCGGTHEASEPTCPSWKPECQLLKIRHTEKISYKEALLTYNKHVATVKTTEPDDPGSSSSDSEDIDVEVMKASPKVRPPSKPKKATSKRAPAPQPSFESPVLEPLQPNLPQKKHKTGKRRGKLPIDSSSSPCQPIEFRPTQE